MKLHKWEDIKRSKLGTEKAEEIKKRVEQEIEKIKGEENIKMKNRTEYLKNVIADRSIDPLKISLAKIELALIEEDIEGLIKVGAPDDEYKELAKEIYNQLRPDSTKNDLGQAIYLTFLQNFYFSNFEIPPYKQLNSEYIEKISKLVNKICNDK